MEEKRTKLQVGSLLATGALFVIFLGVYLFQFTRPGAFIAGEFFPAQPAGDTVLYQGELHGVPGVLIFEPQEDGGVFLLQFGGFSEKYGFAFGEEEGPHGRPLAITGGDGAFSWQGRYWPGDAVGLWDENHNPVGLGDWLSLSTGEGNATQDSTIRAPLSDLAQLAAGDNIHYRGSWQWFFFISVLAELLSLTVAFPMAWFKLNHFLSVRDPEPSDFYLAMMKVEWVLVPVLLLIGYLWGLTLYT